MGKSGFLERQAAMQEDMSIKLQYITRQFMIDTLQITLHQEFGWGYERIMRLTYAWEKNRREMHPAIDPRDAMCDVEQEHIQRIFDEICKGKADVIPFQDRYPYLKEVKYGGRRR